MIEAQIGYIAQCLERLKSVSSSTPAMVVTLQAAESFQARIHQQLDTTVWNRGGCSSWYKTSHGKNYTLWPGTTISYRFATRRPDFDDFVFF